MVPSDAGSAGHRADSWKQWSTGSSTASPHPTVEPSYDIRRQKLPCFVFSLCASDMLQNPGSQELCLFFNWWYKDTSYRNSFWQQEQKQSNVKATLNPVFQLFQQAWEILPPLPPDSPPWWIRTAKEFHKPQTTVTWNPNHSFSTLTVPRNAAHCLFISVITAWLGIWVGNHVIEKKSISIQQS